MRVILVGAPERLAEADALGATVQPVDGPLDHDAQTLFWLAQTRAAPDVIWLDWTALQPPDVELIRQYRIMRGHVRIVVQVPDSLQPPDPGIAALVSMGIYDVVTASDGLAAVLDRQPIYGDVARWHTPEAGRGLGGGLAIADPEIAAAQVIAVVSGKGGVGKTSFAANCLVAASGWGAIGLDADFVKPTLHLAFRAPDEAAQTELGQLLSALEIRHRESGDWMAGAWTDADRAAIRQWLQQAELVAQGVRLASGPSRASPVPVMAPPGLVTELAEASKRLARLTLIDTPGSTNEDSWVEAVQVADWIVLITTPDYPSILESVDVLRKLDYLRVPRSRVWLVINQRGRAGYATPEITQTHLPLPLLAEIPADPAKWHRAWRLHQPPALKDRAFWNAIVQRMIGVEPDRPRRRNPFRWRRASA